MSPAGQPVFECEVCGHSPATVVRMTVTYQTSIEVETKETEHRHVSTTYLLHCSKCGHDFSATVDVPIE